MSSTELTKLYFMEILGFEINNLVLYEQRNSQVLTKENTKQEN